MHLQSSNVLDFPIHDNFPDNDVLEFFNWQVVLLFRFTDYDKIINDYHLLDNGEIVSS